MFKKFWQWLTASAPNSYSEKTEEPVVDKCPNCNCVDNVCACDPFCTYCTPIIPASPEIVEFYKTEPVVKAKAKKERKAPVKKTAKTAVKKPPVKKKTSTKKK